MAANATFALKPGLCVRRTRLVMVAPDTRHSRRSQAETPLIGLSEFGQPPLLHRYCVARDICAGKDVLDVASGEGYGSALLAGVARRVVGVEIDVASVTHARNSY